MKQIIVVKPNSISGEGKKLLQDEGIVLIEHENPNEVRVINNIEGFEGDDIFNSAIGAIMATNSTDFPKTKFASLLLNAIQQKRGKV